MRNDPRLSAHEALLNVTWGGQNGDLPDPVPFTASDHELRRWAKEAIVGGGVPGVRASRRERVDLSWFVVDRFPATRERPFNRLFLRPKTPFGAES